MDSQGTYYSSSCSLEEFSIIKHGIELVLPHSEVVPQFHSVERRLRETSQPLYENQLRRN